VKVEEEFVEAFFHYTDNNNNNRSKNMLTTEESIYESVKNYYRRILQTSKDLKTSACVCASKPHPIIKDHS
jgi:hypothetical protein